MLVVVVLSVCFVLQNVPLELVSMMESCWNANPEDRPDFGQLCDKIEEFTVNRCQRVMCY